LSGGSTQFARKTAILRHYPETEVHFGTENKAVAGSVPGTKVTSDFGMANANIRLDCVIRDQQISKQLNEGK
jgi:hypothetical protein